MMLMLSACGKNTVTEELVSDGEHLQTEMAEEKKQANEPENEENQFEQHENSVNKEEISAAEKREAPQNPYDF